jgi:peptidoglycan/LPS O-acetylase OafA/YrhL
LSFILKPLYLEGWRAVDLFFCLSGFIFYWLYSKKIVSGATSFNEFFVLRFSRLYPLHFVTLMVAAAGQFLMLGCFGSFFVYPNNDLYHFLLQLVFASNWGFEQGNSFNGPVWSVSVEVFLYALFFVVCALRRNRWWQLVLLVYFGHFLLRFGLLDLSRGILSFFAGGLTYQLFNQLWRRGLSASTLVALVLFTLLLWAIIPLASYRYELLYGATADLAIVHQAMPGHLLGRLTQNSYELILFPATILTLAVCEAYRGTLGQRLSRLGNISYSVYLIHFPLQLLVAFGARYFLLPNTFFYSPWVMLAFFSLLIPLSLGSYQYLERPMQKRLRASLLPKRNSS